MISSLKGFAVRHPRILKGINILIGLVLCVGAHITVLVFSGNFHAVVDGEAYRSAQPSPAALKKMIKRYSLKSVINLRGRRSDKEWYQKEVAAASESHIQHIDFKMASSEELSPEQVTELIRIMRDAPKPVLIHCDHGINRSGLASALYLAAIKKGSERDSELQLSPMYGYWPLLFLPTYAMFDSWENAESRFGF